jgi:glucosamine 6-phosphate synthetase-like amidotransferase/phosphosugar isomerase protein
MRAAISQSGETRDVFKAVCKADAAGLPVFSVVNAVGSLIARTTKLGAPYGPSVQQAGRQAVSATFLSTVTD